MAEVKGYKCDRPGCDTFEVASGGRPGGWLTLVIRASVPRRPDPVQGGPNVETKESLLDLCGNRCLAILAIERTKEIDGSLPPGIYMRAPRDSSPRKKRSDAGRPREKSS